MPLYETRIVTLYDTGIVGLFLDSDILAYTHFHIPRINMLIRMLFLVIVTLHNIYVCILWQPPVFLLWKSNVKFIHICRPASVPLLLVPQESHSQAGLATVTRIARPKSLNLFPSVVFAWRQKILFGIFPTAPSESQNVSLPLGGNTSKVRHPYLTSAGYKV